MIAIRNSAPGSASSGEADKHAGPGSSLPAVVLLNVDDATGAAVRGPIRKLRLEQGLTQVDFAARCGFYQTYLSWIETGRANPSLNAIELIAATLGMDVFQLFGAVRTYQAVSPPAVARKAVNPVDTPSPADCLTLSA